MYGLVKQTMYDITDSAFISYACEIEYLKGQCNTLSLAMLRKPLQFADMAAMNTQTKYYYMKQWSHLNIASMTFGWG